ncbi:integrase [Hyphomicrobium nitrativorans NL23]|uniref:Integrase n=1 Tax=Hyphomicrobium nitrativorans NL23 TaxID=1029756 RepID=V5SH37_9HYPH|nr:tyrosine-type recombinase/integrase [Hyphomicrobium nitrativorans]AHB49355.1 integrase [Hyphomicrobium nitrativorans NL23]
MAKIVEGYADRLRVPAGARDVQVFDDDLPGFGIRKFASGKASYFVKYNVGAQQRRKTLGRAVRGNLKAMRLEASGILAKAHLGTDVVAVAKAAAAKNTATLGDLVPKYLDAREADLRLKSHFEVKRYLERSWRSLHRHPIDAITRQNVVLIVDQLAEASGKVAADRARMALSGLFGWAIDRGYLDSNPTLNVRARAQGTARSRVLTEAELVEVWNACLDDDYGRIVRILMLTGQRRAEIGDLERGEADGDKRQIELPEHRTKNGRAHIVPLSDSAMDLLEAAGAFEKDGRDLVFGYGAGGYGGWSKSKAELDARISEARDERAKQTKSKAKVMPPWTLHDLRRSFVTHVSERGFAQPHVVEAIVNHVSGAKAGVAGIYNRASYLAEKRQALELWANHLKALVDGRSGSNVVPLTRDQGGGVGSVGKKRA